MPAFSPLLSVYQATTQAAMDGVDPSKDPTVQAKIADAQAAGFNAADINSYYQSGVTAPSRTSGGDGFLSSITNSIPLIETVASAIIPGAAPVIAGINAAQSIASGKPINLSTALNVATALSGTNIIPPEAATAVKTANQALAAANALKTGNVAGLVNSVVQITGASSDTKAVMNGVNLATALSKNDMAGALNALNNLTGSVDPKVAGLATTVIKQVDPTLLGTSTTSGNAATTATTQTTPASTQTNTTSSQTTPTSSTQASASAPQNPLQPGATGVNWNQASTIAAGIGLPDLAHVLYHGKYLGPSYEKIDPQTGKLEFTETPQTTGLPGTQADSQTTVAGSDQPTTQAAQPQQDSIMAYIDKIMGSDTSATDLQNIILGA